MTFSLKKSLAATVLMATVVVAAPSSAFATPEPSPIPPAIGLADTIATDALTSLETEVAYQEKLAADKAAAEAAAAEKAAAEKAAQEAAAAEAKRKERNEAIKNRLQLEDEAFSRLTGDDLQALAVEPCVQDEAEDYSNGQLPKSALCALEAKNHFLRPHAALAFNALSKAFERKFEQPLCLTDSYRTLEQQYVLKAKKPHLAARPGTSNHGWGLAVDLCGKVSQFNTDEHEWLRIYGPSFGWDHPKWARKDGSKPKSWHWEYAAVDNEKVLP